MTLKAIDPNNGWVEEDGRWVWDGQSAGSIEDGDTEGQVTTWDGDKWTPDSAVVVSGGNVGIGTDDPKARLQVQDGFLDVREASGPAKIRLADQSDGFCESSIESISTGTNRSSLVFSTREGVSGVLPRMTIDATGNVGIGTTPNRKLHIAGDDEELLRVAGTSAQLRVSSVDNKAIDFANPAGSGQFTFTNNGSTNLTIDAAGDATFSGAVTAGAFVGDGSGLTGVGGGLPDGDFTHNGRITATDFIATSDERAKDNITTAPVGLIDSLKGREWDWKESGEKGSGVVAQELEQVLPHLVHTDDEGMKSVAYNGLVAYLIEEVKALRAEVEALK